LRALTAITLTKLNFSQTSSAAVVLARVDQHNSPSSSSPPPISIAYRVHWDVVVDHQLHRRSPKRPPILLLATIQGHRMQKSDEAGSLASKGGRYQEAVDLYTEAIGALLSAASSC
jgi:hypothetical protein